MIKYYYMVLLESQSLNYGALIKDFNLPDIRTSREFSNNDLMHDVVVITFICNHCPYVIRIIDEFSAVAAKTKDKVDWVAISSNDPNYNNEDDPSKMSEFARSHNFSFPYLFDETQEIAKSFGAVCTPDIFVYKKISGAYKLAYHARFQDLEKAINELLSSDKVSFEQLPSAGCSIKWRGS